MAEEFEHAVTTVREAAHRPSTHTPGGVNAARRLAEGVTFASVSSDLAHREAARSHLEAAKR